MFAEKVGFKIFVLRPDRKLRWHSGDVEFPKLGILHPANGAAGAQMRVGDGLGKIQYGPAWDTMAFEGGDSLRARRKGLQPGFD